MLRAKIASLCLIALGFGLASPAQAMAVEKYLLASVIPAKRMRERTT